MYGLFILKSQQMTKDPVVVVLLLLCPPKESLPCYLVPDGGRESWYFRNSVAVLPWI